MASAEPVCVLLCRNWKRRRTSGRKSGWSLSGKGGSGKKSESGKESGGTARGRRSGRGNGRGKGSESGRETETKTATAGPEREIETETGRERGRGRGTEAGTEAGTGALSAADPGEGGFKQKLQNSFMLLQIDFQRKELQSVV